VSKKFLEKLGLFIESGIAKLKEIITEKLMRNKWNSNHYPTSHWKKRLFKLIL
jgi:hypothetical protein